MAQANSIILKLAGVMNFFDTPITVVVGSPVDNGPLGSVRKAMRDVGVTTIVKGVMPTRMERTKKGEIVAYDVQGQKKQGILSAERLSSLMALMDVYHERFTEQHKPS